MSLFDSDMIAELKSLPKGKHHEDSQDAAALAPPPTAGILGTAVVLLNPKMKEKPHVDIPLEPDIFKPTKSMLDILSDRIDSDLHKQWNDTIKLVTIATKETFDDYVQLFDNQHYDWQLLNLDNNILLLEAYHVKTYPAYVILKSKNRIGMAPAPSPNHYLDAQVRRISKYL